MSWAEASGKRAVSRWLLPNDEPDVLLLERLHAERTAPAATPPKPKRGRKAGKQFTLFTP